MDGERLDAAEESSQLFGVLGIGYVLPVKSGKGL